MKLSSAFLFSWVAASVTIIGCSREDLSPSEPTLTSNAAAQANVPAMYRNISPRTLGELQQARTATMKYRDINVAIAEGYVNINVDVPGMGHHYMNFLLVDGTFDPRYPEILVYDSDDQLVALEYAVAKDAGYSVTPPEGFTGSMDEWNPNTVPELWLLHAWVWKYNINGVFAPFNPDVHID